jgi:hypothetical protein
MRHGFEGTTLNGFHYDLNFLSYMAEVDFPYLNIWLKNCKKIAMKVHAGCLLIQKGNMLAFSFALDTFSINVY